MSINPKRWLVTFNYTVTITNFSTSIIIALRSKYIKLVKIPLKAKLVFN